ncbi:MAG: hypothetical protein FWG82_03380 [Oscillospiraceae bacterium]|nr:hypothetical protein [Oscillospiraceae bacterium]
MKKTTINEARRCPEYGKAENQVNAGKTAQEPRRCFVATAKNTTRSTQKRVLTRRKSGSKL